MCGLALGLAACSSKYDPSGSYQGEAGSIVENFKPSTERAPYGESFKPVEVKSLGGDLYEVRFGPCSVNVKRPAKSDEHLYKLAEPKTCSTKVGEVKIAQGHLQVWSDQDKVNFGFEGLTSDDRYKVLFTFAPSSRAPAK